jgi:hypothetical protein
MQRTAHPPRQDHNTNLHQPDTAQSNLTKRDVFSRQLARFDCKEKGLQTTHAILHFAQEVRAYVTDLHGWCELVVAAAIGLQQLAVVLLHQVLPWGQVEHADQLRVCSRTSAWDASRKNCQTCFRACESKRGYLHHRRAIRCVQKSESEIYYLNPGNAVSGCRKLALRKLEIEAVQAHVLRLPLPLCLRQQERKSYATRSCVDPKGEFTGMALGVSITPCP